MARCLRSALAITDDAALLHRRRRGLIAAVHTLVYAGRNKENTLHARAGIICGGFDEVDVSIGINGDSTSVILQVVNDDLNGGVAKCIQGHGSISVNRNGVNTVPSLAADDQGPTPIFGCAVEPLKFSGIHLTAVHNNVRAKDIGS